jgi:TonB family protein
MAPREIAAQILSLALSGGPDEVTEEGTATARIAAIFRYRWIKYGLLSLLFHGLVVSIVIPAFAPSEKAVPPIEVVILDQRALPPVEPDLRIRPLGVPKNMITKSAVIPKAPPAPAAKAEARQESPAPSAPAPLTRDEIVFRDVPVVGRVEDSVSLQGSRGTGTGVADGIVHTGPSGSGKGTSSAGSIECGGSGIGVSQGEFGGPGGPAFLRRETPEYPLLAKRRNKEGAVSLMVTIDERGRLLKVDVASATDPVFVGPSVEAIRRSTFVAARRNGIPVTMKAILPIRFVLSDS